MRKLSALAISVALVVACTGCGDKEKTVAPKEVGSSAVNVSVQLAKRTTIEDNVTYTGEIKASQSTSISSKVSGTATAVYKEVGDYVNEGDILVQIDKTDYQTQLNQANAAYNQAKAGYESALAQYNSVINGTSQQTKQQLLAVLNAAQIEYNNAKTNYDNQKILYENGAISKAAFEGATTRFENAKLNLATAQNNYNLTVDVVLEESKTSAQAGVNTAKAAMETARVSVDAAQNALNNTTVKAPIAGYIATRNANVGQMVPAGVEVFSIKATQSVEAQINVTETIVPSVSVGTKATVGVKAAGLKDIVGTVTNVSAVKNAQTGMYQVIIALENSEGLIKDGMFADITLTLKDSADALIIPSESILEEEDQTKYVYVAKGDKAEKAEIVIGIITDEYTEVVSGISDGDKVIVSGKEYLSEKNNEIKVVE